MAQRAQQAALEEELPPGWPSADTGLDVGLHHHPPAVSSRCCIPAGADGGLLSDNLASWGMAQRVQTAACNSRGGALAGQRDITLTQCVQRSGRGGSGPGTPPTPATRGCPRSWAQAAVRSTAALASDTPLSPLRCKTRCLVWAAAGARQCWQRRRRCSSCCPCRPGRGASAHIGARTWMAFAALAAAAQPAAASRFVPGCQSNHHARRWVLAGRHRAPAAAAVDRRLFWRGAVAAPRPVGTWRTVTCNGRTHDFASVAPGRYTCSAHGTPAKPPRATHLVRERGGSVELPWAAPSWRSKVDQNSSPLSSLLCSVISAAVGAGGPARCQLVAREAHPQMQCRYAHVRYLPGLPSLAVCSRKRSSRGGICRSDGGPTPRMTESAESWLRSNNDYSNFSRPRALALGQRRLATWAPARASHVAVFPRAVLSDAAGASCFIRRAAKGCETERPELVYAVRMLRPPAPSTVFCTPQQTNRLCRLLVQCLPRWRTSFKEVCGAKQTCCRLVTDLHISQTSRCQSCCLPSRRAAPAGRQRAQQPAAVTAARPRAAAAPRTAGRSSPPAGCRRRSAAAWRR